MIPNLFANRNLKFNHPSPQELLSASPTLIRYGTLTSIAFFLPKTRRALIFISSERGMPSCVGRILSFSMIFFQKTHIPLCESCMPYQNSIRAVTDRPQLPNPCKPDMAPSSARRRRSQVMNFRLSSTSFRTSPGTSSPG
ncbi:MAG: Uncharacterised protein [Marine Group II euryarchaeote MED-G33]|nr:MAG: Uncharacterised protein [Marine Group II euryarchaeote MED-G33]